MNKKSRYDQKENEYVRYNSKKYNTLETKLDSQEIFRSREAKKGLDSIQQKQK